MRRPASLVSVVSLLIFGTACTTQQPQTQTQTTPPRETAAPAMQVDGNMLQVMRGILFPNSNVIFAAQGKNPADIKPAADPATSTDPLTNTYGGWTAVENSGIAIAEAANLLTIPGRQ